jgi:tryptophan synthase alpha chain
VTGITGSATPQTSLVAEAVERIKAHTDLPVVVGFGVKSPEQAAAIGRTADGVAVGSAIVSALAASLNADGQATDATLPAVTDLVQSLSQGVRAARMMAAQ